MIKFPYTTSSSIEIAQFALQALEQFFIRAAIKKVSVIILYITPDSEIQLSLFQNRNSKHSPLMQIVNRINQSFVNKKSNCISKIRGLFGNETGKIVSEVYN